ncbi:GAF domain-containing protein [Williamsia sp. CHRR-6]|uniref:GAF domain-containing protein n=1 Tax=Williamsia sp. CHRR-6 TaxID=2835871 RepID=UPI001BDB34A6|nr:GAF domain-containing protein [Williamsia sp. CHRR-6]MBT0567700.1 GAF domain-containing protein [Williamsia sp. CHRR-6]
MTPSVGPVPGSALWDARIRTAYEDFRDGRPANDVVRSVVRDSWMRSLHRGVNPRSPAVAEMTPADFADYRAAHPMTAMRPLVQSLLLDDVADAGVVVALTDEVGRLLWLEGDRQARDRAAAIDFVEGALWSEEVAGTNAPGLALRMDRSVQIVGAEHFAEPVQEWSCAAAPVHDPVTGHVIGVLDVTGGRAVAEPFALATVRSVVAALEMQIRYGGIDLGCLARSATPRLEVLSATGPQFIAADGSVRRLSPRHGEILLLLSAHPHGLGTDELALALSDDGVDAVTVRAEISRLRRDLGAEAVLSRPYRLGFTVETDVAEAIERARGGDVVGAIEVVGRGGLLADSHAPGVVELFEEVLADLRSAVVAGADRAALQAWTACAHGRDDAAAWSLLGSMLGPQHPEGARAAARVQLLDRRLGL